MTDAEGRSRRQVLGLAGAAAAALVTGGAVGWRLSRTGSDPSIASAGADPSTTGDMAERATGSSVPNPDGEVEGENQDEDEVEGDQTTTTVEAPWGFEPYELVDDEVFGVAKLAGVRMVEALLTLGVDESLDLAVGRGLQFATPGLAESVLVDIAGGLHLRGAASAARVVYPQLGGLDPHSDPTTGSIMVVVEQHLRTDGGAVVDGQVVSRCVDVRVVRGADDQWLVSGIEDTSGSPVAEPVELSDEARRVLDHGDIDLPDSVRWDIYDGIVDRRLLDAMANLADDTPIRVTTCKRGHPINVFGTAGRSAHTVGRAVDIWAVDGRPVVQQREVGSVAHTVARGLYDAGHIHRLGSPWSFGSGSWTDPVHQDHLHLGINA